MKRRWDWEKGRDPHSHVEDIVFSPDGKQIAAAVFRRSEVRVLSVIGQQEQTLKHNSVYGLDFGPDGTLATAGWNKAIRLWNATTGELQKQFVLDSPQFQDSRMYAVRISPDGRLLAAALMDGHIFVADAKTLATKNSFRMDSSFIFPALAFSPDSLRVATGDSRGRVRVWDPLAGAKFGIGASTAGTCTMYALAAIAARSSPAATGWAISGICVPQTCRKKKWPDFGRI